MLDDRVRAVLDRLEREDEDERARGAPTSERARQVARTTGQFLFSLVAPQTDCEVLELGGSRGYSTIWLAAGARIFGGRVLSLEHDRRKIEAAIANARGTVGLRESGTPLHELVWSHRPSHHRSPRMRSDWQSTSPESAALSKTLKRAGFRFVGPTTVYSTMQACGVVNDHLVVCHVHDEVEREIQASLP